MATVEQPRRNLPPPREERRGDSREEAKERMKEAFRTFRSQLNKDEFRGRLKAHVPAAFRNDAYVDQLCEGLFLACRDNPSLLTECDRASLLRAVERTAKRGLPVGAGGCWMVPYKGMVQDQLDYRGALTLVRRSGMVKKVTAQVVRENDLCEIMLGTEQTVIHKPKLTNRGKPLAVYALAWIQGEDMPEIEIMELSELEEIRQRAPSKNSPAWRDNAGEMYRKICLKRLCKRLPVENPNQLRDLDEGPAVDTQAVDDGFADTLAIAPPDPERDRAMPMQPVQEEPERVYQPGRDEAHEEVENDTGRGLPLPVDEREEAEEREPARKPAVFSDDDM